MVRNLIHDPLRLGIRSVDVTAADLEVARDLADTLWFHRETCVGMAANMIGVHKRIIAVVHQGEILLMLNPEILRMEAPYDAQEGCLSLLGGPRPTRRYEKIKVRWQTVQGQKRIRDFEGFTAQIIQHEVDHCNGVLI